MKGKIGKDEEGGKWGRMEKGENGEGWRRGKMGKDGEGGKWKHLLLHYSNIDPLSSSWSCFCRKDFPDILNKSSCVNFIYYNFVHRFISKIKFSDKSLQQKIIIHIY